MFEKPLDQVSEADIEALIVNAQPEGQQLDYKQDFPKGEDLKDLIRHVTGMSNTRGGCIIIGMEEKRDEKGRSTGEPERIHALTESNLDNECLRLANSFRDSVSPRMIPEPEMRTINTKQGPVVIVRIQPSLLKPHMFRHRFYARQGAQTVPLEAEQVRAQFVESESLPQRLREFRITRIAEILGGDVSALLESAANLVVHVCPLEAFTSTRRIDIESVSQRHIPPPGRSGAFTYRLNFTGVASFSGPPGEARTYLQVFRDGCVEYASTTILSPEEGAGGWRLFRARQASNLLALDIPSTLAQIGEEITPYPLAVMVSFFGLKGARGSLDQFADDWTSEILEDRVLIQEIILQEAPKSWGKPMRGVLDSIWQAMGQPNCPCYDEHGNYVRQR